MLGSMLRGAASLALAAPLFAMGCGGGPLRPALGPVTLPLAHIDADPSALLLSRPVALVEADAKALLRAGLGAEMAMLLAALVPLGPSANFYPVRDVQTVWMGVYSLQGVDVLGVLQGAFDVERIRAAATSIVQASGTAVGSTSPLVREVYGGVEVFSAGNVGFVALTPRTLLAGNEVALRRAIDRLRTLELVGGKLPHAVPPWMHQLGDPTPGRFAIALDLVDSPGAALAPLVPYLTGLQRARVLGDFEAPGLRFAGTLGFRDEPSAAAGAAAMHELRALSQVVSLFSLASIFSSSPPKLSAEVQGTEVGFAASIEEGLARTMLRFLDATVRSVVQRATSG
jgi:hypothetical protein